MLRKGSLEVDESSMLEYCSRLLLFQKVLGGWRLVMNLSRLNGYITLTKFVQDEDGILVLGAIRRVDMAWLLSLI